MIDVNNYKQYNLQVAIKYNKPTKLYEQIVVKNENYMLKLEPYSNTYFIYFKDLQKDEQYYFETITLDVKNIQYLAPDYDFFYVKNKYQAHNQLYKYDKRFIWSNEHFHLLKQLYIRAVGI